MTVLVSGASGFIGKALARKLQQSGYKVIRLVRTVTDEPDVLYWHSAKERFSGLDVVVHLSGEPIFKRWTKQQQAKILSSRINTTSLLCDKLLDHPPKVFITPSAVGYYGDCGEEELTERSKAGTGFLSNVCMQWENASRSLEQRGSRTIRLRFGLVLGRGGGIIQQLLLPYRLGLGGPLGSGKQWMSWIALDDLVRVIEFVLKDTSCVGSINAVSPNPLRQEDFAKQLAAHLHRKALLRQPAWLLHILFGKMADELLLASTKVIPERLLNKGFHFQHSTLDSALRAILK